MRFSVILGNLGNLGNTRDRFCDSYKQQPSRREQWARAAAIAGVAGVELVGTWDITESSVGEVKDLLAEHRLRLASIIPDHFTSARFGLGAFTSRDPAVRREAVAHTTAMMDACAELGGDLINLWPGQDGFDYPLQADHVQQRDWLVEGITRAAAHRRDVRLALEYKPKEPRCFSFLARAADTLLVALDTGAANVGVTIDTGHALMGGENLAASACLLAAKGRLFHLHWNDNYRSWDDDLIVGSVHLPEYLELLHWLPRLGYDGWYSMDQYPYREDGQAALNASIRWLDGMARRQDAFGQERFTALTASGEAVRIADTLREFLGLDVTAPVHASSGALPPRGD